MNIKIETERGWMIFDNISGPVEYYTKPGDQESSLIDIVDGVEKIIINGKNSPLVPVVITFKSNMTPIRIETDLEAFIVNDEGKTTERIN